MDGMKRQNELAVKHLQEKIDNQKEVLANEKDTREMWVNRYEKEQQEHTATNASLLQAKSDLKDQILATKNAEIKLQTVSRQIDSFTETNKKLQESVNENMAKAENIERELNTQKEIQKNLERSK